MGRPRRTNHSEYNADNLFRKSNRIVLQGGRLHRVIVGTSNMNALCRANRGAQLAADAFFHAVFVAVEYMTTVKTIWFLKFLIHFDGTFLSRRNTRPPEYCVVTRFFLRVDEE